MRLSAPNALMPAWAASTIALTVRADASAAVKECIRLARSATSRSLRCSASRFARMLVVSTTMPIIWAGRPSSPGRIRPLASIVRRLPSALLTRYSSW